MKRLNPKLVWQLFLYLASLGFIGSIFVFGFGVIIGTLISTFTFIVQDEEAFSSLPAQFVLNTAVSISNWIMIFIIPFFILHLILSYIWAQLTYHYWKYETTEEEIRIKWGIIFKEYVSIPYKKIQNVRIHQGIISRLLGLSDIYIYTAAGKMGELAGLNSTVAEKMKEELIKKSKT